MTRLLPEVADARAFENRRRDHAAWVPAIRAISERHGLSGELEALPAGSVIVFGVGDGHVVKMHEPWHREHCDVEASALSAVAGRLPVTSPQLVARGELEGWSYLVMERLPGQILSEAREKIPKAEMTLIARAAGELARAMARVPIPPTFAPFSSWPDFIRQRREVLVSWHRQREVPDSLVDSLEDQIAGAGFNVDVPVFLHTELTDTNLMVERVRGRWRLSGVIDFEPAMTGHPHYELPALTIFVCRGEPELCRAALEGYGLTRFDDSLRSRLLAMTLVHRYSHLGFFLEQVGVTRLPSSWDEIGRALFGA